MKKLIDAPKDLHWVNNDNYTVEIFLSDEMPEVSLCTSAYALVFKDKKLLQTELKEGERLQRMLDIPGGHIDDGETPEDAAVRETFEETGVRVVNPRLVAHIRITKYDAKLEGYRYPYPVSYMLYYLCDFESEEEFNGNEDAHGREWITFNEFEKSIWCKENKILLEEVMSLVKVS